MRSLWHRTLPAALVLSTVLGACYSGSLPQKRGSRPLTMPQGEHEVIVGVLVDSTESDRDMLLPSYRVGLTDRLELTNLASLAYRVPIGRRTEIRFEGGFTGYFSRRFRLDYSGDPRDLHIENESAMLFAGGVTAKVALGNEVHAIYSLRVNGSDSSLYGKRIDSASFRTAVIYDGFGRLSIALPISTAYGLNRDNRNELLGNVIIGGFGPTTPDSPVFSYVANKQLDVFMSPWAILSADLDLTLGASIGINWHWD